jgi:hypothetical protein
MLVVVSTVNHLCYRHHSRTFETFLEKANADCSDLIYHLEVRWMSEEQVSSIAKFIENEPTK